MMNELSSSAKGVFIVRVFGLRPGYTFLIETCNDKTALNVSLPHFGLGPLLHNKPVINVVI